MSSEGRLDIANTDDCSEIAEVLTDAFAEDPLLLWMFPDPDRATSQRHHMMTISAERGVSIGHTYVWRVADRIDGVALWAPPGASFFGSESGQRLGDLMIGAATGRMPALGAAMGEVRTHLPDHPHFHLQFFGVRSSARGRGLGGRILAGCLEWIDRLGHEASLESSNARNLGVYERQGFEVRGEITLPPLEADTQPAVIRPMLRPRASLPAL